jgi:protein SCO1/2
MSKKLIFYIAFFTVLILGFFFALSYAIPGFAKSKLPPISRLEPFRFINQDGQPITEKNVRDKVVAVEYFFTTCPGICPRMNNNLRKAYDALKDEKDFLILSHTCDPDRDSVPRLKRFADSMKVDTDTWMFLTGRKDSLYNMARYTYKIDDPQNNFTKIEDDFLHSQFIALLNRDGEVVQIFDGLKGSEINELIARAKKELKN